MVGQLTRLDEFADPCGKIFSNARQSPQLLLAQVLDSLRRVEDEICGIAIRANLERICPFDLEHVPDLAKHLRNRAVVHGPDHEEPEELTTKRTKVTKGQPTTKLAKSTKGFPEICFVSFVSFVV